MGGIVSFCDHEKLGEEKKEEGAQRDLDEFVRALSNLSSSSSSSFSSSSQSLFLLWKFKCENESSRVISEAVDFGKKLPVYDNGCVYVALHIFSVSPSSNGGNNKDGHEGISSAISPSFECLTPRGLKVPISFRTRTISEVTHDTYVWNGKQAAALVKATAVAKAYQLERVLREGNMTNIFQNIPRHSEEDLNFEGLSSNQDEDENNSHSYNSNHHHFFRALLSYSATGSFLNSEGGLADFSNLFDNRVDMQRRENKQGEREQKKKKNKQNNQTKQPPGKAPLKLQLNAPTLERGGIPTSGRVPAPASKLNLALGKIEPKPPSPQVPKPQIMVPSASVECQGTLEHGTERPPEIPLSTRDRVRFFNRICSRVTDQLYLGSDYVAQNLPLLQESKITHVLNCAGTVCNNYFPEHFTYKTLHLLDGKSEDVLCVFLEVLEFLHTAWCAKGRIFIHCQQGISRSSTMLICYLMQQHGKPYQVVAEEVKRLRDISSPNAGFMCQLTMWERILAQPASKRKNEMTVVLPHNLCAPDIFPLKSVPLDYKSLDSRVVLILTSADMIYLWIGKSSHPDSLKNAEKGIERMHTFLRAPEKVVVMKQGEETKEFCDLLKTQHPIKEIPNNRNYDAKFSLFPLFDAKSLPEPVEREQKPDIPELWVYRCSWLQIKSPTQGELDNLLKDDVIVCVLERTGVKSPHAYLWIGNTFEGTDDKEVNNLGLQFLTRNSIFMNFSDYKIIISRQGKEKEDFWKVYKETKN